MRPSPSRGERKAYFMWADTIFLARPKKEVAMIRFAHLASFDRPSQVPLEKCPVGLSLVVGGRLMSVVNLGKGKALYSDAPIPMPIRRPDDGRTFVTIRRGNSPAKSMKEE